MKGRTKEQKAQLIETMKKLESENHSRREIARACEVSGPTVTRYLGAVRPYMANRRKQD